MDDDDRQLAEMQENLMSVTSFFSDLATAKQEFPTLRRNKVVRVRTKTGGEYSFAYAPLEEILQVEKALNKHGLSLSQREVHVDGQPYIETTLAHKDGHSISGNTRILTMENGPQAYGSALTYARRYGITLLLCLATDEDDDGNAAEGNSTTQTRRGDRSGRPDTSGVDRESVSRYVESFTRALQTGDNEQIYMNQDSLKGQAELYTAIWDGLSSKQRTDLRKIISERTKAA